MQKNDSDLGKVSKTPALKKCRLAQDSLGSWFGLFYNVNVFFAWCAHNAEHIVRNSISSLTPFTLSGLYSV